MANLHASQSDFYKLVTAAKVHLTQQQPAEAIPLLMHAVAMDPQSDDALCCLGAAYLDTGKLQEAETCLQKALAIAPALETLFNLGLLKLRQRQFNDAVALLSRVIEKDPKNEAAWKYIGQAYFLQGKLIHAILVFHKIAKENPASLFDRHLLLSALKEFAPTKFDPAFRDAILLCLDEPRLSLDDLNLCFMTLMQMDPAQDILRRAVDTRDYNTFKDYLRTADMKSLQDALLLKAMGSFLIRGRELEAFFTYLRRYMLDMFTVTPATITPYTPFLKGLATQCFLGEYVYYETDAEALQVAALAEHLQKTSAPDADSTAALLLFAAYRPLVDSEAVAHLVNDNTAIVDILRIQVADIREERALRATIPSLGVPQDDTSRIVRAMYEENPYPRWNNVYNPAGTINSAIDFSTLRAARPDGRLEVLNAGCGTGRHVVLSHVHYPNSNILGVDLSIASLAFAKKRCAERDINNIIFMQADILELGKLGRQFDIIESTGVLHHLKDPMAGWRVLTDLLKPGGYMRVALYSEKARQDVVACRNFIAEMGFEPTLAGIRACRKAIKELPPFHITSGIMNSPDFYSTSLCRDLIFHVQEHRFTIPKIKECLHTLGLKFVSFDITLLYVMQKYLEQFPEDIAFTSLDNWDAFERSTPLAFRSMYQFWCRKPS